MVNSQFADAMADGFYISCQTKCEAVQSRRNYSKRPRILKPNSPFPEGFCLLEFEH